MDEPSKPTDVALPTGDARARRKTRRWLYALGALAAIGVLTVGGIMTCAVLHFRNTPDFATFVREHPARAAAALAQDVHVLSTDGSWSLGQGDPFAAPREQTEGGEFVLAVRHGEDRLLDLRQRFAYTLREDGMTRSNFAVRTERVETGVDMHASVRIVLHDADRLIGPNSARAGSITFEVELASGAGPNSVEVVEGPLLPSRAEESLTTPPLLERVVPWSTVPEDGLVHSIRHSVFLTGSRTLHTAQSDTWGGFEHSVNTTEYSFRVEMKSSHLSQDSTSWEKELNVSWNDRAW